MKRNSLVILIVVAALALMAWSGYQNMKRRRMEQQQRAQGVLVPDASNQTVSQDVAADEGLPNMRGKKAPRFTLRTIEGKKVSLADYKGRAVLINFWATWCAPCKIELPWIIALRKQYQPQGFEVLGIDVDKDDTKDKQQVIKFAEKQGMLYPILVGDDAVSKAYGGVEFFPTSYYIGKNGKIVAETAGLASRDEIEANIKKSIATGGE